MPALGPRLVDDIPCDDLAPVVRHHLRDVIDHHLAQLGGVRDGRDPRRQLRVPDQRVSLDLHAGLGRKSDDGVATIERERVPCRLRGVPLHFIFGRRVIEVGRGCPDVVRLGQAGGPEGHAYQTAALRRAVLERRRRIDAGASVAPIDTGVHFATCVRRGSSAFAAAAAITTTDAALPRGRRVTAAAAAIPDGRGILSTSERAPRQQADKRWQRPRSAALRGTLRQSLPNTAAEHAHAGHRISTDGTRGFIFAESLLASNVCFCLHNPASAYPIPVVESQLSQPLESGQR